MQNIPLRAAAFKRVLWPVLKSKMAMYRLRRWQREAWKATA